MTSKLKELIEKFWEERNSFNQNDSLLREAINLVLSKLDGGELRICEKKNNEWKTNEWLKKAILLSFKSNENSEFNLKQQILNSLW